MGTVHAHGPLAKPQEVHPPQHHDPHGQINYAQEARSEMREAAAHPTHRTVLPGAKTGVEAWDKVNEELPSHHHPHQNPLTKH